MDLDSLSLKRVAEGSTEQRPLAAAGKMPRRNQQMQGVSTSVGQHTQCPTPPWGPLLRMARGAKKGFTADLVSDVCGGS